MRPTPRAFTLVELLVVVTIIVILLAMLTPALERAVKSAEDVKCAANLDAVSMGLAYYIQEHRRTYPLVPYYSQLFGEKPRNPDGSEAAGFQNSSIGRDVDQRPLNKYLGYQGAGTRVPVAECPRDQGDGWNNSAKHCYTQYGTSYIEMWDWRDSPDSWYRIQFVFGTTTSKRPANLKRTSNKVIVADWPVYGDRYIVNPQHQWHGEDRRLFTTLFADSHAEMFDYDIYEMEDSPAESQGKGQGRGGNNITPPNYSFDWW
jgi:prepilin-type N-terminal cleavage/methylation domain-containing protein